MGVPINPTKFSGPALLGQMCPGLRRDSYPRAANRRRFSEVRALPPPTTPTMDHESTPLLSVAKHDTKVAGDGAPAVNGEFGACSGRRSPRVLQSLPKPDAAARGAKLAVGSSRAASSNAPAGLTPSHAAYCCAFRLLCPSALAAMITHATGKRTGFGRVCCRRGLRLGRALGPIKCRVAVVMLLNVIGTVAMAGVSIFVSPIL